MKFNLLKLKKVNLLNKASVGYLCYLFGFFLLNGGWGWGGGSKIIIYKNYTTDKYYWTQLSGTNDTSY